MNSVLLNKFRGLGEAVNSKWKETGFKIEKFSGVARSLVEEFSLHKEFQEIDFFRFLVGSKDHVTQFGTGSFGTPPLTLYNDEKFVVDLYYWTSAETSIHDHSFCGAFSVLSGSTLHIEYDFDPLESPNPYLTVGHIKSRGVEFLRPGDVREIALGDSFIHRTMHLGLPTISLCVRTVGQVNYLQHDYHPDHVRAVTSFDPSGLLVRKKRMLRSLRHSSRSDRQELIWELILNSDLVSAFLLTLDYVNFAEHSKEKMSEFYSKLAQSFGEWTSTWENVMDFHRDTAMALGTVHFNNLRDEQKLLIGLLMSRLHKAEIFDFLESLYPGQSASNTITGIMRGFDKSSSMALPQMALDILSIALEKDSPQQVLESFLKRHPTENVERRRSQVQSVLSALEEVTLLRPLLFKSSTPKHSEA